MTDTRTHAPCNGDGLICDAEIGHHAGYAAKTGLPIAFDDLNRADTGRNRGSGGAATACAA